MLRHYPQFQTLSASVDTLAHADEEQTCTAMEVLELAQALQSEFDRYFGANNWFSGEVTRTTAAALSGYATEVPCSIVRKLHAVMRLAENGDVLMHKRPLPARTR